VGDLATRALYLQREASKIMPSGKSSPPVERRNANCCRTLRLALESNTAIITASRRGGVLDGVVTRKDVPPLALLDLEDLSQWPKSKCG
jgi:hypothetical protein